MKYHKILNLDKTQIKTGYELLKSNYKLSRKKLKTKASNINKMLSGGFSSNTKYLIFGANKTGKTQICHYLCLASYLFQKSFKKHEKGYNPICSLYFDTENTFRPERILRLSKNCDLTGEDVLKSILVSKIMSSTALLLKLEDSETKLNSLNNPLLIVDSLNNYFRLDQGNAELSYYRAKMLFQKTLEVLFYLTTNYDTFTVATAQVTPHLTPLNPPEIPVGNIYLNRYFSEYIYLTITEKQNRFAHLVKSYSTQEKKVLFKISDNGIEDVKI